MRKFLISIATAASVLAIATPASAQYYGGGYGYNNNNGYDNYGYGRHRGGYDSRELIAANRQRMARIEYQIRTLEAQGRLSRGEAARLECTAAQFRRELNVIARNGMTGNEGAIFDARADRLGQEVQTRAGYGYGYGGRW
jgi:hypothetical protein